MHRSLRIHSVAVVLALASVGWVGVVRAQSTSVVADPSVSQFPYSVVQGQAAPEVWKTIDDAEYWAVPRGIPTQYYDGVDVSDAAALRAWIHAKIAGHTVFPYTHSSRPGQATHKVDVWDIIALAEAHPLQPDRVLDVYLNSKLDRQYAGGTGEHYDREHTWPKSLGFPTMDIRNPAYSDCHHLMAAYQNYNASRGNKPYGSGEDEANRRKPTLENLGRGGSNHDDILSANYSYSDRWQTWIGRRGDVARAMFYMDVRYDGGTNEADLQLTNDIANVTARNVWESGGVAYMGLLDDLVKWHTEDPVDDLERRRNTVIFLFQGNRNPFIDHPEWVAPIFAGGAMPGVTPTDPTDPVQPAVTPARGAKVWISELHYDNDSEDVGEFVEVTGPAGTNLAEWSLVAYNGNGGKAYKTIPLTGAIPNQQSGFGTLAFDMPGLQNGAPDGIALVDASGAMVEFLSYEGQFNGADGPAAGQPSVNIMIEETGTTPGGHSLQRQGAGVVTADMTWAGPATGSRGRLNPGQSFP